MRIPCPYCGARDLQEFVFRGDASVRRPSIEEGEAAFADYVYLRDNPVGRMLEHWYHAQGCRNWLIVERDSRTHVVDGARLAKRAQS